MGNRYEKKSKKGFVVSDLHLFTKKSRSDIQTLIDNYAKKNDFCILNGDIFDFQWTALPTQNHAVNEAISWIIHLCDKYPNCHFYHILGNHDCYEPFVLCAEQLKNKNFSLHRTHLLLGKHLFMHGDLPLLNKNPFIRNLLPYEKHEPKWRQFIYAFLLTMHVHHVLDHLYRPKKIVKRIYNAIAREDKQLLEKINHIHFGHTHVPFNNFVYKGINFHNTGAGVVNVKTNLLEITH